MIIILFPILITTYNCFSKTTQAHLMSVFLIKSTRALYISDILLPYYLLLPALNQNSGY